MILNNNDVSEYLKIAPNGLEVSQKIEMFFPNQNSFKKIEFLIIFHFSKYFFCPGSL